MTNNELSKAIRADLKAAGFAGKDYSIHVRDAGYETSVNIKIKNPLVRASDIKAVVAKYEEVERDSRSYEILSGGNTFVFVGYESGVLEEAASGLVSIAEKVLANPQKYSGRKIAQTEDKEAYITQYDAYSWTLSEFDKDADAVYTYHPTKWIRSATDLAIAMFRFKAIGTIYA